LAAYCKGEATQDDINHAQSLLDPYDKRKSEIADILACLQREEQILFSQGPSILRSYQEREKQVWNYLFDQMAQKVNVAFGHSIMMLFALSKRTSRPLYWGNLISAILKEPTRAELDQFGPKFEKMFSDLTK
jgi:hypothetical protein